MADVEPPRSRTQLFVENRAAWQSQRDEDRRLRGVLRAHHVENGVVLPLVTARDGRLTGGVLRPDGTYVASSRHLQHAVDLDSGANVLGGYALDKPPTRRPGTVVYAGGGGKYKAYGHFLVEELSRLWYVFDPELRDVPVVFVNPRQNLDDAGFALLEAAGVSRDRIIILDEPTAFDDVIVPDQALFLHPGSMHHAEAKRTYDGIRDSVAPGPYEKIYLTYRQMKPRQLAVNVNEEMLEDLYRRNGFTIIAPETLSMTEQLSAVAGAREIACTAGTLSHLVAFAQDGVKLDIFIRDKNYMPQIQWSLDEMRGAQVNIVDTLRPVFPSNARRGVIYFTSTPEWARFARERFDSTEPSEPPPDYVERYLRAWAQLLGSSRKWALDLMPEWRASDLVASIYSTLLPAADLSPDQRLGLERRFYAPERLLDELRAELRSQRSARDQIRTLERRLQAVTASRSWRATRPLRAVAGRLAPARRAWRKARRRLTR